MERHLVSENRLWAALGVQGHILKHGLDFVVAVKTGLIIFPILLPTANSLSYPHHCSPHPLITPPTQHTHHHVHLLNFHTHHTY